MSTNLLRRLVRWASEAPHPAEQYYSANLSLSEERDLMRRNYLLLQTGQAALGLIGPEVIGIAVEARPDEIVIHVAVTEVTEAVDEDVAELALGLELLLNSGPEQLTNISTVIHLGPPDPAWPGHAHDILYRAKR